ncbi:MAG: transglutaminase domain-containing protein [Candidatus Loosdrechtia sp.]|uniref:transglutaminase domain-containing protein n=1 Tax=Candidatus Loosdrechtia sp. TaxID=3101272 RepID=UPI003A791342|nr:MAG: hypothetical protein QY305_13765 [Candidatus Jettenia sp. AMX2]
MKYIAIVIISIVLPGIDYAKAYAGKPKQRSQVSASYADVFLQGKGYKPVPAYASQADMTECGPLPENTEHKTSIPDNYAYRDWCEKTFTNGEQIYEAYKEIAFDIDYQAEPPRTDYWQTPLETLQSKLGDCEDSIFVFFSMLSDLDVDGDMVWGLVVEKETSNTFAHVWYQLFDKQGKAYIVEGFSKEWNGIIPVEMLTTREERVPTLLLKHNQVVRVVDEMVPKFLEESQFLWHIPMENNIHIKNIFEKLQDMFRRYKEQMQQS